MMDVEDKSTLLMCTLAHGLNHAQILIIASLLPIFREIYNLSYLSTEAIISTYLLFYALFNPLSGIIFHGIPKRLQIALEKIISGGGLGILSITHGYIPLLAIHAFLGSAGGVYHPAGTSILADKYNKQIRGRIMGIHGFGGSLGMILGPLFIAFFISKFDYHYALNIFIVISVLFGLIFLYSVKEHNQQKDGRNMVDIFKNKRFQIVVIAFGLRDSVFWGIKAFLPIYAVSVFNFSLTSAIFLLGLLPVIGLISNIIGGFLADKFNRIKIIKGAIMLTTLSLGGFYFLSGKDAFFLLVILTSFGIYMTLPIFDAIVADISSKNDYFKSYGGMYGVGFFLGALVPLGLGLISDYIEPRAGFLLLSGLMLISFVATSRFK